MSSTRELLYNGKPVRFRVDSKNSGETLVVDDSSYDLTALELSAGRLLLRVGTGTLPARVVRERDRTWVWLAGRVFEFQQPSTDHAGGGSAEKHDDVRAPMPGNLVKLLVKAGDEVEEGQVVALVEAMKMEHPLRAPRKGVVASTAGTPGSIVDTDMAIVALVPEEA